MNRKFLAYCATAVLVFSAGVYAAPRLARAFYALDRNFVLVRKAIAVRIGSSALSSAMMSSQSDGTKSIFRGYDSSGNADFIIGTNGEVTTTSLTTATLSNTGTTTFSDAVTINDSLLVDGDGVSDVQVRIDGTSGQAVDILQVRTYDGTEKLEVDSSGNTGVKGNLAVTGTSTLTGAVSVVAAFVLPGKTSDPCGTLGVGAMFRNTTNNRVCFCDSNTDDMIVDGSTDCF